MKYLTFAILLIAVLAFNSCKSKQVRQEIKIVLIPLDDRPTSTQFPQKLAEIGNAELTIPPDEIIGRFTDPGQPEKIINWIKGLDLASYDGLIISSEMLAYGGLVASRVHDVSDSIALSRLDLISYLKENYPDLKIYAQSVIMRIAPTGTKSNTSYSSQLAQWGEISVKSDTSSRKKTKILENSIPGKVLRDYKMTRERNLAVNLKMEELVKNGMLDFLIFSQDDAKPVGVHVADKNKIKKGISTLGIQEKVLVQAGTDEVAMLLLCRLLNEKYGYSPKIKTMYSSENMSHQIMPYEDNPLIETVDDQIKSVGGESVSDETKADILFFVFTSRFEKGVTQDFIGRILDKFNQGKEIMIGDIDPKGDVQGGDSTFTTELIQSGILPKINSYASWNTAGNTIGTALPQGVIYSLALRTFIGKKNSNKIISAEKWFLFHRILDDFYYHNLVRGQIKRAIKGGNLNSAPDNIVKTEQFARNSMQGYFDSIKNMFSGKIGENVICDKASDFTFSFPWSRIFEAQIDFDLNCRYN